MLIYLASQSPRRQQLLHQIGVPFELLLPDNTEAAEELERVLPDETPLAYVQRVTLLKLKAAKAQLQTAKRPILPVLCADTTVALGSAILGKPANADEAALMLSRLSGQTHQVFTALALSDGRKIHRAVNRSKVVFDHLTADDIADYVATGEPMGKAGAYGIQGPAARFIKSIQGSYSGIMGLPLHETSQLLRRLAKD